MHKEMLFVYTPKKVGLYNIKAKKTRGEKDSK
jgi:hypothetical protein